MSKSAASELPAVNLARLAEAFSQRYEYAGARALIEGAGVVAHAGSDLALEAVARDGYARLAFLFADHTRAIAELERAVELFGLAGDDERASRTLVRASFFCYDAGDHARAAQLLDRAQALVDACRCERGALVAVIRGYRGNLARSRGDFSLADAEYESAIGALAKLDRSDPDAEYAAVFQFDRGVCALLRADVALAIHWFAEARTLASARTTSSALSSLIAHYELLAGNLLGDRTVTERAREVFRAGDSPMLRALASLHGARSTESSPAASETIALTSFEHGRLSLAVCSLPPNESRVADDCVYMDEATQDIHWTDAAGVPRRVSLSTRAALYRIVRDLLRAHAHGARRPAALLIEAGWPNEALTPASATNRLKVAISTLRQLGMRDLIARDSHGYFLRTTRVAILPQPA